MDISSIKLPNGNVCNFKDTVARVRMTEINWSNLVSLRNSNQLIPGMQYRITDYHTTTSQANTKSANHQFDIIVTADSTNKLNESARAIQHAGDTYFSNCNLAAWKIWYCLDNDSHRFAWAESNRGKGGKGVIYRMIDEYNNDCPYDFKNIQFVRYYSTSAKDADGYSLYGYSYISLLKYNSDDSKYNGITDTDTTKSKYLYTFSLDNNGSISDASVGLVTRVCRSNVIGNAFMDITIDDTKHYISYYLNNIVLVLVDEYSGIDYPDKICCNKFGIGCSNCTLVGCKHNTFGNDCGYIILGEKCMYNTISSSCSDISFGRYSCDNFIGERSSYIHLSLSSFKNDIEDCDYFNSDTTLNNCVIYACQIMFNTSNVEQRCKAFNHITVYSLNNEDIVDLTKYVKLNKSYPQFIGINSSGTIVSYTLDSIINNS